jgi:hypothetical protein
MLGHAGLVPKKAGTFLIVPAGASKRLQVQSASGRIFPGFVGLAECAVSVMGVVPSKSNVTLLPSNPFMAIKVAIEYLYVTRMSSANGA